MVALLIYAHIGLAGVKEDQYDDAIKEVKKKWEDSEKTAHFYVFDDSHREKNEDQQPFDQIKGDETTPEV